ncbi:MAG: bifunctional glutamate N-acetyltransferase/amino-acid acetyltransferase ArgJ [Acidimicrobiales bacterium]
MRGVTAPAGFVAAGGPVGIKPGGEPDLAVVATADGRPVAAAGVFTDNRAAAAAVSVSRSHLAATGGRAAGVVLTSGNANAATGAPGEAAVLSLCRLVAAGIGSAPEEVLAGQTGLIGVPFPIETVEPRVAGVVDLRAGGEAAGAAAANAIMTTDTVRKEAVATGRTGAVTGRAGAGRPFTVGGMAKGAAMLAPRMATMLAVLTTDAGADPQVLAEVLAGAVGPSFNAMTVDGSTSTNDTVLLLAGGAAGPVGRSELEAAVGEVCASLAAQMVADAEGATKVVHVVVTGARSDGEAHRAARKVAGSLLVKCSVNGEDPYWGRVVSELGSAGVDFEMDRVTVRYGGTAVCVGGVAAGHDEAAVAAHMGGRHVEIGCELGLADGTGAVTTTDLGHGYLDLNRTTS